MSADEKTNTEDPIFWLDLETTGLEPGEPNAKILECAWVITTNSLDFLTARGAVIANRDLDQYDYTEFIRNMHGPSGTNLLQESRYSEDALPLAEVDYSVSMVLKAHFSSPPPLAGNSIQFDREWMKIHMPRTFRELHYRNMDLSSIREFAKRWKPNVNEAILNPLGRHRAVDDLVDTIKLARFYRAAVFGAQDE